ncbi:MAG: hypothetical protein PHH70_05670 [Candidatus Gracilibacteria bacterium]|nr:hypothetical protein [Candidatus Gracilibacteria bacterium]
MTKNESTSNATTPTNPVIIETKSSIGQITGILGILFGCLGILFLGIVFFPLTIVMAGIALWKKNYLLGVISSILAILVFVTSPTLWGLVALKSVYDKGVQEQTRIQQIANRVIETKKQETIATPPSAEVNFSKVASKLGTSALGTPERSYSDTLKLATNMMQNGGDYLNQATPMDLSIIAYDPWIGPGIQGIHEQFARSIKENRTEIQKFPIGGSSPNIEAITGKYQYSLTGVVLSLKNVYLEVASSSIEKFIATSQDLNESEEEAVRQSLKGLKEAIMALQSGTTPSGPISVIIYGKDGKVVKKSSISISKFPNGTYGILVTTTSASSTEPTVENTKTKEVY